MKEKIDKLDQTNINNICSSKDTIKKVKRQAVRYISRIYKELFQINKTNTDKLFKKWAKDWNRFHKMTTNI